MYGVKPRFWQEQLRMDVLGDRYKPVPDADATVENIVKHLLGEAAQFLVFSIYEKGLTYEQISKNGHAPEPADIEKEHKSLLLRMRWSPAIYLLLQVGEARYRMMCKTVSKHTTDAATLFKMPAATLCGVKQTEHVPIDPAEDTISDLYLRCSRDVYLARKLGNNDCKTRARACYQVLSPCLEAFWSNGLFLDTPDLTSEKLSAPVKTPVPNVFRKEPYSDMDELILLHIMERKEFEPTGFLPADARRRLQFCMKEAGVSSKSLAIELSLSKQLGLPEDVSEYLLAMEYADTILDNAPVMELLFYDDRTYLHDPETVRVPVANPMDWMQEVQFQLPRPLMNALMINRPSDIRLRTFIWGLLQDDCLHHEGRTYQPHPEEDNKEDAESPERLFEITLPKRLLSRLLEYEPDINHHILRVLWHWFDNPKSGEKEQLPFQWED